MKKVIILDFDGVFYSSENKFKLVPDYVERNRRKFLPNVSDEEYTRICNENPKFVEAVAGCDIAKEIINIKNSNPNLQISTNDFWQVQEDEVYDLYFEGAKFVIAEEIKKICETYSVYIVSNSSPHHIHHYMNQFKVNPKWFKGIFSNHFEEFDLSKKHYYEEILKKENISSNEAVVFGDSDKSDLQPAREIGIKAVLTNDADKLHCLILKEIM